jgi:hypothetical protein
MSHRRVINISKDEKEKDISKGRVHQISHEIYDFADETVAHAEGVSKEELMLECYNKLGQLLALWAKKLDKIEGIDKRPSWLKEYIESEEKNEGRAWVDLGREFFGFEVDNLFFAKERESSQLSDDLLTVSQPFSMWMEDFRELVKFCDKLGLDFYVDGFNSRLPGRTLRVVIYKPRKGPHTRLDFRENSLFAIQTFENLSGKTQGPVKKEALAELLVASGRYDKSSALKTVQALIASGRIAKSKIE